ncbi:hypothetical protein CEP52_002726 [Fusarium oligoseptatum]|uniref:Phosphoglycerate mutase n=1 Tax=Fusarium oligoseptatum TaxID=2604345 RepID=A0A428UC29_9HYPO|nr:hypothetical protein CEP52_002726 [Fusarium oligoseptatum]
MGRTPAYIFVVRHGNRLDAADKKWHLSSPTPYDPPLTYGGWLQSRQVGNQISSILEQAKIEHEACGSGSTKKKKTLQGGNPQLALLAMRSNFRRNQLWSRPDSSRLASSPFRHICFSSRPPKAL